MSMVRISARWDDSVIVCGKCSKKVDGGFGAKGKTSLAKALRRELGVKKGRKARIGVIETRCLGLCPKRGVTMVHGTRPREWMVVAPGTPVTDVIAALGVGADPVASVAASPIGVDGLGGSEAFQA
jgi:predicted metal-binding protein